MLRAFAATQRLRLLRPSQPVLRRALSDAGRETREPLPIVPPGPPAKKSWVPTVLRVLFVLGVVYAFFDEEDEENDLMTPPEWMKPLEPAFLEREARAEAEGRAAMRALHGGGSEGADAEEKAEEPTVSSEAK